MSAPADPKELPNPTRMSREILVYDLLLVGLNIGYSVLIYHFGSVLWAKSGGAGIELSDALVVVLLTILWCVANLALVIGLMAANRRAAGDSR